jgi:hypothetical protein
LFVSVSHASQDIDVALKLVNDMLSSLIEHVVEWLELLSVLVQNIRLIGKLFGLSVKATNHEYIASGCHHVSSFLRDVKLVLDHNGLGHEVCNIV